MENEQLPDWLRELGEPQQEQWEEPSPPVEEPPEPASQFVQEDVEDQPPPALPEDVEDQPPQPAEEPDVLESLREQIVEPEEEPEREWPEFIQVLMNMKPFQRFVLALLLFFDVALCGCMLLVMAGRVMLPF